MIKYKKVITVQFLAEILLKFVSSIDFNLHTISNLPLLLEIGSAILLCSRNKNAATD